MRIMIRFDADERVGAQGVGFRVQGFGRLARTRRWVQGVRFRVWGSGPPT